MTSSPQPSGTGNTGSTATMRYCPRHDATAWLLLLMATLLLFRIGTHPSFTVKRVRDTASYLEEFPAFGLNSESVRAVLRHKRTIGYPLLLQAVQVISPDLKALPLVHGLIHVAAIGLLWWTLRRRGTRPWTAFALALPLLAAKSLTAFGHQIGGDSTALSLAIAATAGSLLASRRETLRLGILLMAVFSFAAIQVRPAYLFLIPLLPLVAFLDARLSNALGNDIAWRTALLGYPGVTIGPYLGWCLLRLALVGHFGLVSFGGINLVGFAAQMISPPTRAQLPVELQPLADAINARWQHVQPGFTPLGDEFDTHTDYPRVLKQYTTAHGSVAEPVAEELYHLPSGAPDPVMINNKLGALSLAVIKARPKLYLKIMAATLQSGTGKAFRYHEIMHLAGAFLLAALLLAGLRPLESNTNAWHNAAATMLPLILLALLFFAAKALLVSLVETGLERYFFCASVFIPAVLAGIGAEILAIQSGRNLPED